MKLRLPTLLHWAALLVGLAILAGAGWEITKPQAPPAAAAPVGPRPHKPCDPANADCFGEALTFAQKRQITFPKALADSAPKTGLSAALQDCAKAAPSPQACMTGTYSPADTAILLAAVHAEAGYGGFAQTSPQCDGVAGCEERARAALALLGSDPAHIHAALLSTSLPLSGAAAGCRQAGNTEVVSKCDAATLLAAPGAAAQLAVGLEDAQTTSPPIPPPTARAEQPAQAGFEGSGAPWLLAGLVSGVLAMWGLTGLTIGKPALRTAAENGRVQSVESNAMPAANPQARAHSADLELGLRNLDRASLLALYERLQADLAEMGETIKTSSAPAPATDLTPPEPLGSALAAMPDVAPEPSSVAEAPSQPVQVAAELAPAAEPAPEPAAQPAEPQTFAPSDPTAALDSFHKALGLGAAPMRFRAAVEARRQDFAGAAEDAAAWLASAIMAVHDIRPDEQVSPSARVAHEALAAQLAPDGYRLIWPKQREQLTNEMEVAGDRGRSETVHYVVRPGLTGPGDKVLVYPRVKAA